VKPRDILEVKNALVKSASYCVTERTVGSVHPYGKGSREMHIGEESFSKKGKGKGKFHTTTGYEGPEG
jgi:hypothetical protein